MEHHVVHRIHEGSECSNDVIKKSTFLIRTADTEFDVETRSKGLRINAVRLYSKCNHGDRVNSIEMTFNLEASKSK